MKIEDPHQLTVHVDHQGTLMNMTSLNCSSDLSLGCVIWATIVSGCNVPFVVGPIRKEQPFSIRAIPILQPRVFSISTINTCIQDPRRLLSTSAPATIAGKNNLLGNFEESVLNGRLEPVSTVEGFTAEIGASGMHKTFSEVFSYFCWLLCIYRSELT